MTGSLFIYLFCFIPFFHSICFCLFSDEFLAAFDLFRHTSLALARRDWVTQSPHMWCAFQTPSRFLILFFLSSRPEGEACKQKRKKKKIKTFFLFRLSSGLFLLLLLYFCLHPFADTHRKISSLFFFIPSSLYLDDERVWIRSGRVYGTSISGLVNEAEIRQPSPNDEVKSKGFFIYTQQRERLSLVKQRERVYRKGQYKTRKDKTKEEDRENQ